MLGIIDGNNWDYQGKLELGNMVEVLSGKLREKKKEKKIFRNWKKIEVFFTLL